MRRSRRPPGAARAADYWEIVIDTADTYDVSVAVLGRLRAWRQGQPLDVGPPLRQAVLAVLALNANRTVTRDEIIDAVWGETPPASAVNGVQVHVAWLRRGMEPRARGPAGRILASGARGYTLRLNEGGLDADAFANHLQHGRRLRGNGDLAGAASTFESALRLWQGTALAGVPGAFAETQRTRLEEMRLAATEEHAAAMLALGQHGALIAELTALAGEHPLREQVQLLLITALDRARRQADALAVYARTRQRLIEELGIEPGAELQRLHRDILAAAGQVELAPAAYAVVPRQLPPALAHFAGRTGELDTLTALLDPHDVVVVALDGTAGVGKTALAVRWSHQVIDRFPDGQLYVNLRGYDPGGPPVSAPDALQGFLSALAVPPDRVPTGPAERSALYRSLLAGKRVLVVLDNAATADQVRPLLPASPGCAALVTSRNQLTSLAAVDGAHPLALDLPSPEEARQLLTSRLGRQRVDREPEAADEIIARCARLPLALAIIAARAVHNPGLPLAALAAELGDEQARLDALDGGDAATQARTVFSWSYQRLSDDAAALFRQLGLHPGPDIGLAAAASMAAASTRNIRTVLAELIRAGVLTEPSPGRYAFHDLLRVYAGELAYAEDDETTRSAALHRLFDHYRYTGHAAALLLRPTREPILSGEPRPGVTPEPLTGAEQARAWFTAEHAVLSAAVDEAASNRAFQRHAWHLAWTLSSFLDRKGQWQELVTIHETALRAVRSAGDRDGQAYAHRILGKEYGLLGRYDAGQTQLWAALDLYRERNDRAAGASVLCDIAILDGYQDRFDDARQHAHEALDIYRHLGHRAGEGRALNQVGWYHARLGEFERALPYCEQARIVLHETGDADVEAGAWDSLGYVHHHLGDQVSAIACYQHALELRMVLGDRYYQAHTLARLGDAHHAAGDLDAASAAWRRALDAFDQLDRPDAGALRDKLARLISG